MRSSKNMFSLAPAVLAMLTVLAAVPAVAASPAPNQAVMRAAKPYTIEQFMATINIGGASFSADGKRILFNSNATGIVNVYSISAEGGVPVALTQSTTNSTTAVGYFPDDDRVLLSHDEGGNELNHLYVRELDGSQRDLTPGDKLKASFEGWSGDGRQFYVSTNERDPRFFDLYRFDAKSYARELIYKNDQGFQIGDVSRDGRWVALDKPNTTADSDVYLLDTQTQTTRHLSKHEGLAAYRVASFDPASKRLLVNTNDGGEFLR